MAVITKTQRNYLRKLANPLKATVLLGKQGLTPEVLTKVERELDAHELIKVRLLDYKDQKVALAEQIVTGTSAALVGIIGNVITLYRPPSDPTRSQIVLPGMVEG